VPRAFSRLRNVFERNSPGSHRQARLIRQFADKTGLLYFGYVNQHSDEHRIIRGLTVSQTHHDDHFCVGTYDGYDVSVVDRQDMTINGKNSMIDHKWILVEIQLQTKEDIPHFILEAQTSKNHLHKSLFEYLNYLKPVTLGAFESYPSEFLSRYTIHTSPSHAIEIQRLIPASTARTIGAHFWPLSVEVTDKSVIVYSYRETVTSHLLDMMLTDGIWIAKLIDNSGPI
jgi:hypothetical protein